MDYGFKAWISDPANLEGMDVFQPPPLGTKQRKKRPQGDAAPINSKRLRISERTSTTEPFTQLRRGSELAGPRLKVYRQSATPNPIPVTNWRKT
ncbi:hypothetical protein FA13DRAFT_360053 [Coprinellus micaceus]|uniref:Uncharacterized protein n=1 Tax=Coprinellus micaceus TaxID=71717 RepID=A0A4Y7TBF2_COPMI|nr:hypothetical protein FA13DRAFT_360053 [Coprinellus micaceus]